VRRRQCLRGRWLRFYIAVYHSSQYSAGRGQVNATASLAFDPPTLTTQVGHAVTFAFGSVGHNVFFDPATGAPGNITGVNANTSVTRTFDTAGTFTYTCHIHPYMQGKVVVE